MLSKITAIVIIINAVINRYSAIFSYFFSDLLVSDLNERKEKKQLAAKHILAIPALSSIYVPCVVFVMCSEVMIIRQNPNKLLDALRICEDLFSMMAELMFQNKSKISVLSIF